MPERLKALRAETVAACFSGRSSRRGRGAGCAGGTRLALWSDQTHLDVTMSDDFLQHYRGRLGRWARELQLARAEAAATPPTVSEPAPRAGAGNEAHLAMRRDVMQVLDRSDLDETQKQRVLAGMMCPCCSGSGTSMILEIGGGNRRKVEA